MRHLFLFLLISWSGLAATWAPISTNSIAWSYDICGVPGGMRTNRTVYTNLTSSADAGNINTAISNCPSNQVVLLGAGTYTITSQITLTKSGVTLRGAGITNTILKMNYSGYSLHMGGGATWSGLTTVNSGYTKGSSNLVMASVSGFNIGDLCRLAQDEDTNLVWVKDSPGRHLSSIHHIDNISGSTITIWPPVYWTLQSSLNPGLEHHQNVHRDFMGLEDLSFTNGTQTPNFSLDEGMYGCWMLRVGTSLCANYNHTIIDSTLCTFHGCQMLDALTHAANHGGFVLGATTANVGVCGSVFENNIVTGTFPSIEMNFGSSGNIVAYNFFWDSYQDSFGNGVSLSVNHFAHNLMNLVEGNITGTIQSDGYNGSSSHTTIFRNAAYGWGPTYTNQNAHAINMNRWTLFSTIACNVFGFSTNTTPGGETYGLDGTNNSPAGDSFASVARFGYPNSGNNSYTGFRPPNAPLNPGDDQSFDLNVWTNASTGWKNTIWHFNFDYKNNAVVDYDSGNSTNFPSSLYLTSKPTWMGSLVYPMIGPDVSIIESSAITSRTNITNPARELYYGRSIGSGCSDTNAPTATITSPTNGTTWDNGASSSIVMAGTASDDVLVSSVTWSNDRGGSGTASGTTSWSFTATGLSSGHNIITVTATDSCGNTGTDTLDVTYTPIVTLIQSSPGIRARRGR